MLLQLRGIGPASAAILAREIFGRSFANRRQLGSYLGLTPSANDSGSVTRCQGISKAGNSFARRVMIECRLAVAQISTGERSRQMVSRLSTNLPALQQRNVLVMRSLLDARSMTCG
jgi:transposase